MVNQRFFSFLMLQRLLPNVFLTQQTMICTQNQAQKALPTSFQQSCPYPMKCSTKHLRKASLDVKIEAPQNRQHDKIPGYQRRVSPRRVCAPSCDEMHSSRFSHSVFCPHCNYFSSFMHQACVILGCFAFSTVHSLFGIIVKHTRFFIFFIKYTSNQELQEPMHIYNNVKCWYKKFGLGCE